MCPVALCILLRRLSYPNRLLDLTLIFNRPLREISIIFNWILRDVLAKWEHLLSDLDQWWLSPEYLDTYCSAIEAKGAPLKKCWGFIDGKKSIIDDSYSELN